MGLWPFSRKKKGAKSADVQTALSHLGEFVTTRRGVEAYVEPKTNVTDHTVLLIAHDGEWTRRRIPNPEVLQQWAHERGIPVYDANIVGYPQRMRDWNARRRAARG